MVLVLMLKLSKMLAQHFQVPICRAQRCDSLVILGLIKGHLNSMSHSFECIFQVFPLTLTLSCLLYLRVSWVILVVAAVEWSRIASAPALGLQVYHRCPPRFLRKCHNSHPDVFSIADQ